MFVDATSLTYAEVAELVGLCDLSHTRMNWHNGQLQAQGLPPPPTYHADDFDRMITECKPDTVIVTTIDAWHHHYIVRALNHGCDVISEKPLTTTIDRLHKMMRRSSEVASLCALLSITVLRRLTRASGSSSPMARSGDRCWLISLGCWIPATEQIISGAGTARRRTAAACWCIRRRTILTW